MPSIEWNRKIWSEHHKWRCNGDEWHDQARFCNQPYERWKEELVRTFIKPHVTGDSSVLEIAPGHGRWTAYLVDIARQVVLVDLNPACIEFCQKRFQGKTNIEYYVNDGMRLPNVRDQTIHFIWSFDSFVHMDQDVIESYFNEFHRVLAVGGKAIIHHPDRRHATLPLYRLSQLFGNRFKNLYRAISMNRLSGGDGNRSNVSARMVAKIARRSGLEVLEQEDSWGAQHQYNIRLFRDRITTVRKP